MKFEYGSILGSFEKIKVRARNRFEYLYMKKEREYLEHITLKLKNISSLIIQKENYDLMCKFLEEKIWSSIWDLTPTKAPRPSHFTIHFYRECWNIIIFLS